MVEQIWPNIVGTVINLSLVSILYYNITSRIKEIEVKHEDVAVKIISTAGQVEYINRDLRDIKTHIANTDNKLSDIKESIHQIQVSIAGQTITIQSKIIKEMLEEFRHKS